MNLNEFIAIDIESTGLDPDKDEIIEIAMVHFKDSQVQKTFSSLIKPQQEVRPFILKLTGINNEELASAPDFKAISEELINFMGTLPMVAHNAIFDSRFLKTALKKVDAPYKMPIFYDSLLLSRIAWPLMPNHRLETLITELKLVREQSHRALPDAQACGEMFLLALEKCQKFSDLSKYHLAQLSKNSPWENIFGKFTDIPSETTITACPSTADAPNDEKPDIPVRIRDWFGAERLLAKNFANYTNSNPQNDYAGIVERNMFRGGTAVLESNPGINTAQAFLVPALLKVVQSQGRLVISTGSKASLDNLATQLAALLPLFGAHIKVATIKKRNHYLCLRKFNEHLQNHELLLTSDEKLQIMPLIPWIEFTQTGDASENNGFNLNRNWQLWYKLQSDAASCVANDCEFAEQCFALKARKKAEAANVLITQHQLFIENLDADLALLPRYEHSIFCDAHTLPQLSHGILGKNIRFFDLRNQVKILAHTREMEKGLLAVLEQKVAESNRAEVQEKCQSIRKLISECEKQLHRFFIRIGKSVKKQGSKPNLRYSYSIQAEFEADNKNLLEGLISFEKQTQELIDSLQENPEIKFLVKNVAGILSECEKFRKDLEFVCVGSKEDWVYWLEEPGNPHTLVMQAQPLSIHNLWLNKHYKWVQSTLFTSNTLSLENNFDYFTWRMGLKSRNLPKNKTPFVRKVANPWNVEEMRKVVVADFLPNPSDKNFQKEMDALLTEILNPSNLNTLALYTSQYSLLQSHEALEEIFAEQQKLLLSQSTDGTLNNLLDLFRKEKGACLLASQSYAEHIFQQEIAVDLLVLSKLPFPSPGDALVQAQGEAIKERNGNPFRDVFMPTALNEMRLAMDNMLKFSQDKGIVLILDKRVVTEKYGRSFCSLWDNKHIVVKSLADLQKILLQ